jgi:prophage tail gpP-like protein
VSDGVTLPEIVVKPPAGSGPGPGDVYAPPAPRPANSPYGREQATLVVAGIDFQDWESVQVHIPEAEGWSQFRFTTAERDTPPGMFHKIQFMPGNDCVIKLGGVQVINGKIAVRQIAADSTHHATELRGAAAADFGFQAWL